MNIVPIPNSETPPPPPAHVIAAVEWAAKTSIPNLRACDMPADMLAMLGFSDTPPDGPAKMQATREALLAMCETYVQQAGYPQSLILEPEFDVIRVCLLTELQQPHVPLFAAAMNIWCASQQVRWMMAAAEQQKKDRIVRPGQPEFEAVNRAQRRGTGRRMR